MFQPVNITTMECKDTSSVVLHTNLENKIILPSNDYKNDILTSGWSQEATGDEGDGDAGEA